MSMAFTMVTMPVTRDWVQGILTIDEEKGDVRLREDWEKIFSERGITESTNSHHKGKFISLSNYTMFKEQMLHIYSEKVEFVLKFASSALLSVE